ncbi:hypothetical protein [Salininema proteolyticum]|uniref:Uncharacterized protein n=1 Tax=Salininema proteolyticum TaxID=1607685 RepID=A0ABV8U3A7_9ACTN
MHLSPLQKYLLVPLTAIAVVAAFTIPHLLNQDEVETWSVAAKEIRLRAEVSDAFQDHRPDFAWKVRPDLDAASHEAQFDAPDLGGQVTLRWQDGIEPTGLDITVSENAYRMRHDIEFRYDVLPETMTTVCAYLEFPTPFAGERQTGELCAQQVYGHDRKTGGEYINAVRQVNWTPNVQDRVDVDSIGLTGLADDPDGRTWSHLRSPMFQAARSGDCDSLSYMPLTLHRLAPAWTSPKIPFYVNRCAPVDWVSGGPERNEKGVELTGPISPQDTWLMLGKDYYYTGTDVMSLSWQNSATLGVVLCKAPGDFKCVDERS